MATKPTSLPTWATTGTIVEPSSGKKATGWIVEKPPYGYFNWILNLIYQWCAYVSDAVFTSTGSASGVTGDSRAGTGHGVEAMAATSSPQRAALAILPQDKDPSSASMGDTYVNSVSGRMSVHDGTVWGRIVGKEYSAISASDTVSGSGTQTFAQTYTIPAGVLQVGAVLRIKAGGRITSGAGGAATITLYLGASSVAVSTAATTTDMRFMFDAEFVVRTVHASTGSVAVAGRGVISDNAGIAANEAIAAGAFTSLDTTASQLVRVVCSFGSADGATLHVLNVATSD
jgi:hypothetical protein